MRFNFKLRNSICYLSLGHIRSLVRLDLAGVMSCRTCVVFVVVVVVVVVKAMMMMMMMMMMMITTAIICVAVTE